MKKKQTTQRFSSRTTLAALGIKLKAINLFGPILESVKIKQKSIKHTPVKKLYYAFVTILAGAHGLSEINTRLRSDETLQRAFGRSTCAEQSVVQEMLDACTTINVAQMMQALDIIFHQHSRAYRHNYKTELQILDVDMTGMPCGKRADGSAKGYFGRAGIRYGRQMGRVVAAQFEEIVIDRLYPGNIQLNRTLRPLITDAEKALELDEKRRSRTVLRVDAGGGSFDDVNWMLERGYQVHCEGLSSQRAEIDARSVTEWFDDPKHPGRQVGWAIPETRYDDGWNYVRPVRCLVIHWKKKKEKVGHAELISTLEPREIVTLLGQPAHTTNQPKESDLAYAHLYDKRGGTIEIEIREDKQGVGLTKRSKKRFEGQQMVMLLGSLAHNALVWARRWLSTEAPAFARFGIVRLVRVVLQISGFSKADPSGSITEIVLNRSALYADGTAKAFKALLKPQHVGIERCVT